MVDNITAVFRQGTDGTFYVIGAADEVYFIVL